MSHEMLRVDAEDIYDAERVAGCPVTIASHDSDPANDIVDVWSLLPDADVFTPVRLDGTRVHPEPSR